MWDSWSVVQPDKLSHHRTVYIGCMTGTSVDAVADFTAAVFDDMGLPVCYKNMPRQIPEDLCHVLLSLSQADKSTMLREVANRAESQLTEFLAVAFLDIIDKMGLKNYPKENIILSPHGQAIDHQPTAKNYYSDIIVNGPILAQKTGYKTITQHRQAPLAVSMAAPLAPVLIRNLFFDNKKNVILINGGGIANVTMLFKDTPKLIMGFDTGPANGPIDELVQYIINHNLVLQIPDIFKKDIIAKRYDDNGKLASSGKIIKKLYDTLLLHEFFHREANKKSADRAQFGLSQWIEPAIKQLKLEAGSWLDIITTVSAVVADSIVNAIIEHNHHKLGSAMTKVIFYGGMCHNNYIIKRITDNLSLKGQFEFVKMQELGYEPDYFESLLMAYLAYCAHKHIAIDLSYCARSQDIRAYAIPGVVSHPC